MQIHPGQQRRALPTRSDALRDIDRKLGSLRFPFGSLTPRSDQSNRLCLSGTPHKAFDRGTIHGRRLATPASGTQPQTPSEQSTRDPGSAGQAAHHFRRAPQSHAATDQRPQEEARGECAVRCALCIPAWCLMNVRACVVQKRTRRAWLYRTLFVTSMESILRPFQWLKIKEGDSI